MHNWNLAFKSNSFRKKFIISFLILFVLLYFFALFLNYVENRKGHIFYDPFLNFIKPYDVSDFIFYITYITSLVGLIYAFTNPFKTLQLCQMYTLLTLFRITTLFLLPLDPPQTMIPLRDSILESTFYNGDVYVKDLFFSGHTATLFLLFFFAMNRPLKWLFFISAILVAIAVVIQHVHYSYDVIVAPFFAYISYRIIIKNTKFYLTETKITVG